MADPKHVKQTMGWIETIFFRFFAPISAIGAAELGAETFVSTSAPFFFLTLTAIDTIRCAVAYTRDTKTDPDFKQKWTRFYYTFKMLCNIAAITCLILGNVNASLNALIVPGNFLFVVGVAGFTTLEYLIKAFGGLTDSASERKNLDDTPSRTFKNGLFAASMGIITPAMALLLFFPEIQFAHEPIGWLLVIAGNIVPVVGFAAQSKDPWMILSSVALVTGLTLLCVHPTLSFGADHHFNTEVGVALGLVLGGFVVSTVRGLLQWHNKVTAEKPSQYTLPASANSAAVPVPNASDELNNNNSSTVIFSRNSTKNEVTTEALGNDHVSFKKK